MSPTNLDSCHADLDSIGNVRFDKLDACDSVLKELTLTDFLTTAHQEFLTLRSVAKLLSMGDRDLEARMRSGARLELWFELLDEIAWLQKRCRSLSQTYAAAEARLLVILARLSEAEEQRPMPSQ